MHELSIVMNLLKILENLQKERKAVSFLRINLTVNPYSCIDNENINFIFRSITKQKPLYRDTEIVVTRGNDPLSREFILDSIEMETYNEERDKEN